MDHTNKEVILKLHHVWNSGSYELIPDVYADKFIAHWPKGWGINDSHGHDGVAKAIKRIRTAYPDWHEEVADMIIEGDRVVTRYMSSGTNSGKFDNLPATGKKIEFTEISIYRIHDNKVIEQWCLGDDIHLSKQLGLIPEN